MLQEARAWYDYFVALPYPDYVMQWSDGSEVPAELRGMLLTGLQPGFEIEHGEFAWNADKSLTMTFRLSITQGLPKPQTWEINFSYPADEATAVRPQATPAEHEWFTMMVRTHIAEWWEGGPSVVTSARLVKLQLSAWSAIPLAGRCISSLAAVEFRLLYLSTRLSFQVLAFNSVEKLGLYYGHSQLGVELPCARIISIRCPLDTATIILYCNIVEMPHKQLAYALLPAVRNYVQLFKVQRPSKADGRPQERI